MSAPILDNTNLIEPRDVTAFPLAKSASPNGVEYIGRIEIILVGATPDMTVVTYGGVTQVYDDLVVGDVITGPIREITSVTNVTRARVWYLSGT
jgi:hypothetical protein